MSVLSRDEIDQLGFSSVGANVNISDKASFYNCKNIAIGNNVRIDDFCVLSAGVGGIQICNYVHVAVYASLIGAGKITLSNFSNISSRVSIYSSSDDFSGATMTNPTVPSQYTGVTSGDVFVGRHVIIGSGSIILPGVIIEEGAAVGALSLVQENCSSFGIFAGVPAKLIKRRMRTLLELENALLSRVTQ